jgi:hypothetical protein
VDETTDDNDTQSGYTHSGFDPHIIDSEAGCEEDFDKKYIQGSRQRSREKLYGVNDSILKYLTWP